MAADTANGNVAPKVEDDSSDDEPIGARKGPAVKAEPAAVKAEDSDSDDEPIGARKPAAKAVKVESPKEAAKEKTKAKVKAEDGAKKSIGKIPKKPENTDLYKQASDVNNDGHVTRSEGKVTDVPADLNNDGRVTRAEQEAFDKTRLSDKPAKKVPKKPAADDDSSSDDEPLSAKTAPKAKKPAATKPPPKDDDSSDDEDDKPISQRQQKKAPAKRKAKSESDSDDDEPLAKRAAEKKKPKVEKATNAKKEKSTDEEKEKRRLEREENKKRREELDAKAPVFEWWLPENQRTDGVKWKFLEHKGMIFPPPYEPHGISILYEGDDGTKEKVELTPEQEEPATWYAVMRESDYLGKETFRTNFWKDWKKALGKDHVIKKLKKCDFTPIWNWHLKEKEKKKTITTEQKKKIKIEKEELEKEYGFVKLDDHFEKIGNFRVEPPGLFRGRGEHPKQGRIKGRITPEMVTLNMSKDAKVPTCPIEGHTWGEIKYDNTVTWLAEYKDTINGENKYMHLSASSSFKGMSDFKKFEKARQLGKCIEKIRVDYRKELKGKKATSMEGQRATALYLIDKLALRVGGEKGEDEADTVGCCSLRNEHLTLISEPNDEGGTTYQIHLDFLGKDSIRYDQTHEVQKQPWLNLKEQKAEADKQSKEGKELFSHLSPTILNQYLKTLMDGLSAKVFRTYNASRTLDELLQENVEHAKVQDKITFYNKCNREVAILCNHQRAKPKGFEESMEKVDSRLKDFKEKYNQAKRDYQEAVKNGDKKQQDKHKRNVHTLKERVENLKMDRQNKEDNATVALGTSKINYLDPRITVAWSNASGCPLAKVFNKSLMTKFPWAMAVASHWRFEYKDDEAANKANGGAGACKLGDVAGADSDSDEDKPLNKRSSPAIKSKSKSKPAPKKKQTMKADSSDEDDESDYEEKVPVSKRQQDDNPKKRAVLEEEDEDSSDDDVPLSKRQKEE